MTSKEIQEMIIDFEKQIEQFGEMITLTNQLSILKSYKQDLERLETLENNSNKVIKDSVALMNKNLELQRENEKLKKKLDIYQKYTGVYYDEETKKYYIAVDCDFGCKGDVITKEEFEVLDK